MEWYWLVGIVVVGGLIAFKVIQASIGAEIPIATAARLYLASELKRLGFRHVIPDPCVAELAERAASTCEADGKDGRQKPNGGENRDGFFYR